MPKDGTEIWRIGRNNIAAFASPVYRATMFTIRPSRPDEGERIIEIWREAVDATHHFLSSEDRIAIEREVGSFLPQAPLWLVVDQDDCPLAFMFIDDGHMEALFVEPSSHGQGIGAALVRHCLTLHPSMTTDVTSKMTKPSASTSKWVSAAPGVRHGMDKGGHTL